MQPTRPEALLDRRRLRLDERSAMGYQCDPDRPIIVLLFLHFLFLSPLVPGTANAPVLVLVGLLMLTPVSKVEWTKLDQAFTAILASS